MGNQYIVLGNQSTAVITSQALQVHVYVSEIPLYLYLGSVHYLSGGGK